MLSNLLLSLNVVLPLLLVMLTGYFARRIGLCCDKTVREMNNLTFRVFLPVTLFNNIRGANLYAAEGASVLIFATCGLVALFALLMLLVPRFVRENERRGVVVQAMYRSNYALFGLALLGNLFPGEALTIPSLMVPVTVPFYNILSVVCLETFRSGKTDFRSILRKIAKNQLIIACLLGMVFFALGNPVPAFLDGALDDLGGISTTVALFTLGASFRFGATRRNARVLAAATAGKLLLVPLVFLSAAALLGYRGQALGAVLIAFGGPAAVSSFTMAQQMGADGELAGQLVVTTTLFSVLSLFLFIFAFKTLGLL